MVIAAIAIFGYGWFVVGFKDTADFSLVDSNTEEPDQKNVIVTNLSSNNRNRVVSVRHPIAVTQRNQYNGDVVSESGFGMDIGEPISSPEAFNIVPNSTKDTTPINIGPAINVDDPTRWQYSESQDLPSNIGEPISPDDMNSVSRSSSGPSVSIGEPISPDDMNSISRSSSGPSVSIGEPLDVNNPASHLYP
jgi:hypothetical protein